MTNYWIGNTINEGTRENVRDYIMLMLGAPVQKIELDKELLNFTIDQALRCVVEDAHPNCNEKHKTELLQEGSLIYAKIVLGRIRSMYQLPAELARKKGIINGPDMVKEAKEELSSWQKKLKIDPEN